MNTLGDLNTFGNTSVVSTLETLYRSDIEGANIEMPLMAWAAVHDLGNPVTGTITITHTLPVDFANTIFSNANCVFTYGTGASANTVVTRANNVITITGIHTPEDFFAGFCWMDFVRDKAGTGTYTTQIVNSVNSSTPYTYPVVITLENLPEFSGLPLWDIPYTLYGANTSVANNIVTILSSDMTTQILDTESPESSIYTLSWATQDHPYCFALSSASTANVTFTTDYNNGNTQQGLFTVKGTRANVNSWIASGNIRVTKNAAVNGRTDRHTCRIGLYGSSGGGNVPANDQSSYTTLSSDNPWATTTRSSMEFSNRSELQLYYGPSSSGNGFNEAAGYCWAGDFSATPSSFPSNPWSLDLWANSGEGTLEFWVKPTVLGQTSQIMSGVGIFANKIWVTGFSSTFDTISYDGLPNAYGTTTATNSYPRRIQSSTTLTVGTWYHVAVVKNSSSEYRLYINGANVGVYYSSGQTTTTVAATSGWTNSSSSQNFRIGGCIPLTNVGTVVGGVNYKRVWRCRNFAGNVTDVRYSPSVARYTSTFTAPTQPFIWDPLTEYLNSLGGFNSIMDGGASLSLTRRAMTWSLQAQTPESGQITTFDQFYWPNYTIIQPFLPNDDINFEICPFGMYNASYAGRDLNNNPVFLYACRSDEVDFASLRVTKVDVGTGEILNGFTYNFPSNAFVGGSQAQFHKPGMTVVTDQEQANLGISTGTTSTQVRVVGVAGTSSANSYPSSYNPGSGITLIQTTLNRDDLTVLGSISTYINGGNVTTGTPNTVARITTAGSPLSWVGPTEASIVRAGNTFSYVTTAIYPPSQSSQTKVRLQNSSTSITTTQTISHCMQSAGLYGNVVLTTGIDSIAPNYPNGAPNNPDYGKVWVRTTDGTTTAATYALLPGNSFQSSNVYQTSDRVRMCMMSNTTTDGRWLLTGRKNTQVGNVNNKIDLYLQAGRYTGAITLGTTLQDPSTGLGTGSFAVRVGAFAIVRGSSQNRAWMLYTQGVSDTNQYTGADTNYSKGLWYRSIDISDSLVVTLGTPVQITDPATGNIYGMDMAATSTSIGAWTYIYALIPQGGNPTIVLKPYEVSLRIPN